MRKYKNSFFGDLIAIIIIVVFVYFIYRQIQINDLKQIQKINEEFGVNEFNLDAINRTEYIAKLTESKNKEVSEALIEYIQFKEREEELDKLYKLNLSYRKGCISSTYRSKTETIYLKQNKVKNMFKDKEGNKELNEFLNWDKYIEDLENNYNFLELKSEIKNYPICD